MVAAERRDRSWEHLDMGLRAEVSSAGDHSTPWSSVDRSVHAFSNLWTTIPISAVALVLLVCLPWPSVT